LYFVQLRIAVFRIYRETTFAFFRAASPITLAPAVGNQIGYETGDWFICHSRMDFIIAAGSRWVP
jgi:hypothetical protein